MVLLTTELQQSLINMLLLIPYLKNVQNLLFWHDPVSVTKYDCLLYA